MRTLFDKHPQAMVERTQAGDRPIYAIVLDWDVETRRRLEMPILRRYHEWLIKSGVADYSWEQLYEDYRLCVPMCLYIATEYCRGGVNERWIPAWLPFLRRSLTACDDLDCSALW